MNSLEVRIGMFQELLASVGIFFWQYEADGRLVETNCGEPALLDNLWRLSRLQERAMRCWHKESKAFPLHLSDSTGLIWLAEPWRMAEALVGLYVIGPIFSSGVSEASLNSSLQKLHGPISWQKELNRQLIKLPVVSPMTIPQYGIMLHKCLTGENIRALDIRMPAPENVKTTPLDGAAKRRKGTYASELGMLHTIENGTTNEGTLLRIHGEVGTMSRGDPLRQAKNNVISEIALISRAAIRGGLPEETALELADQAVLAAEDCTAPMDAWQVLPDFAYEAARRVRQVKEAGGTSRLVIECRAYIARHLTEPANYIEMAGELGYSRNHLAARFKRETGRTLSEEYLHQRIETAKQLLVSTSRDVSDISESLCFSSPSHFSSAFKRVTSKTPGAYRNGSHKKIRPQGR